MSETKLEELLNLIYKDALHRWKLINWSAVSGVFTAVDLGHQFNMRMVDSCVFMSISLQDNRSISVRVDSYEHPILKQIWDLIADNLYSETNRAKDTMVTLLIDRLKNELSIKTNK